MIRFKYGRACDLLPASGLGSKWVPEKRFVRGSDVIHPCKFQSLLRVDCCGRDGIPCSGNGQSGSAFLKYNGIWGGAILDLLLKMLNDWLSLASIFLNN